MSNTYRSKGFVLPAIIALSLAISITAVTVMQVIVQTSNTLNTQYLTTVAKEAAEAGLVKAGHCLTGSPSNWSQLTPSPSNECTTSTVEAPVLEQDNWKSTFVVTRDGDSNQQTDIGPVIRSKGTVYVYATTARTGTPVRTINKEINSILTSTGAPGNVPASPSRAVTKVASGGDHSCALSAGKVYCWGKNYSGQLGLGNTLTLPSNGDPQPIQQQWPATSKVVDVAVSAQTSCVVVEEEDTPNSNQVWCWGYNNGGQLGAGISSVNSAVPIRVTNIDGLRITALSAGTNETSPFCVLTDQVSLNAYCWGDNARSQIGNNTAGGAVRSAARIQDPNNVLAGKQIISIASNNYSTCGAMDSGEVYCWGWSVPRELSGTPCSTWGQLEFFGLGHASGCPLTWNAPRTPIPASDFNNQPVTKLAAGGWNNCAIAGGDAYCWGNNNVGQLGNNRSPNTRKPEYKVEGLPVGQPITDIDIDSDTACAIAGGQLYCWGRNTEGQLGIGVQGSFRRTAQLVARLQDKVVTSIGTGNRHDCAVATGIVYCWGDDPDKLLIGNSSKSRSLVPEKTSNTLLESKFPASAVAAGTDHTCAILNDRAFCWGGNEKGQVGNGGTSRREIPEQVPGAIASMKTNLITAGNQYSCASVTRTSGYDDVYCWGKNENGQLGNGTSSPLQTIPTLVVGLPANTKITGLSAGENTTCAIAGGRVYCWGANDHKQLGYTGSAGNVAQELRARSAVSAGLGTKTVTSISVGYYSVCAVANAELWCWGRDVHGIIGVGDGSALNPAIYQPTRVNDGEIGSKKVQSVTVSSRIDDRSGDVNNGPFACAVLQAEKNTVCWGSSGSRQLGDDTRRRLSILPPSLPYVSEALRSRAGDLNNQSVVSISAGGRHACSLSANTSVVCWGNSMTGQIGNSQIINDNNNGTAPVRINAFGDLTAGGGINRYVTAISAGDAHTCAVADSAILCWGKNDRGQLGTGDNVNYSVPKLITAYSTVNSAPQETGIRY